VTGHGLFSIPSDAGTVVMHADNRRVDHLYGGAMSAEARQDSGQACKSKRRPPSTRRNKPSGPRAVAPRRDSVPKVPLVKV
jgi:hypothetical protein